ncbi:hypothetical protein [Polaribacter porphyrae]|uniref:hypothetical protein n=1 Tax=Polaribacter porphyrae TaxID=1137780 RepID=UPI0011B06624|nr:hypothetical protein [Polaribacter porphyrae]
MIFILSICLFFNNQITYSQYTRVKIVFKDGSILKGLSKKKGSHQIKFKKDRSSKAKKYQLKDVDEYFEYYYGKKVRFKCLYIKESRKHLLMQEVIKGKVSLYIIGASGQHVGMGFGGNSDGFGGIGGPSSFSIESYYLKRNGEDYVHYITSTGGFSRNFIKYASEFFNDCPKLVEKIKKKEYKKREIREVVKFYNTDCKK